MAREQPSGVNADLFVQEDRPRQQDPNTLGSFTQPQYTQPHAQNQEVLEADQNQQAVVQVAQQFAEVQQRARFYTYMLFGLLTIIFITGGVGIYYTSTLNSEIKNLREVSVVVHRNQENIFKIYREQKDKTNVYTASVQLMNTMQNAMMIQHAKNAEVAKAEKEVSPSITDNSVLEWLQKQEL